MSLELGQIVGPSKRSDGMTDGSLRIGSEGELIVSDVHGRYYEAVSRGNVYSAAMQAGGSLGTALTATAVTLTLYNPLASGVALVLLEVSCAITTMLAAPGAGAASTSAIVLAANANPLVAVPSALTAAVVRSNYLGNTAGKGQAYTAATLPATPVVLRPLFNVSYSEITAASIAQFAGQFIDLTDGKVILAPNTAVTVQAIGAAISGIVGMTWEEVPL